MFAALGRIYEGHPSPAVFGTHLILYSRASQMSTLKYHFPPNFRRSGKRGQGKTYGFPRLICLRQIKKFKSFSAGHPPEGASLAPLGQFTFCACRKYPGPRARGARTPVTDVTGGGVVRRGARSPPRVLRSASQCSSSRRGPWWRRRRSCGYTGPWRRRAWP